MSSCAVFLLSVISISESFSSFSSTTSPFVGGECGSSTPGTITSSVFGSSSMFLLTQVPTTAADTITGISVINTSSPLVLVSLSWFSYGVLVLGWTLVSSGSKSSDCSWTVLSDRNSSSLHDKDVIEYPLPSSGDVSGVVSGSLSATTAPATMTPSRINIPSLSFCLSSTTVEFSTFCTELFSFCSDFTDGPSDLSTEDVTTSAVVPPAAPTRNIFSIFSGSWSVSSIIVSVVCPSLAIFSSFSFSSSSNFILIDPFSVISMSVTTRSPIISPSSSSAPISSSISSLSLTDGRKSTFNDFWII